MSSHRGNNNHDGDYLWRLNSSGLPRVGWTDEYEAIPTYEQATAANDHELLQAPLNPQRYAALPVPSVSDALLALGPRAPGSYDYEAYGHPAVGRHWFRGEFNEYDHLKRRYTAPNRVTHYSCDNSDCEGRRRPHPTWPNVCQVCLKWRVDNDLTWYDPSGKESATQHNRPGCCQCVCDCSTRPGVIFLDDPNDGNYESPASSSVWTESTQREATPYGGDTLAYSAARDYRQECPSHFTLGQDQYISNEELSDYYNRNNQVTNREALNLSMPIQEEEYQALVGPIGYTSGYVRERFAELQPGVDYTRGFPPEYMAGAIHEYDYLNNAMHYIDEMDRERERRARDPEGEARRVGEQFLERWRPDVRRGGPHDRSRSPENRRHTEPDRHRAYD